MAPSGPIPSKAALHALRGIILGTSCSLVLLSEERRRRITIARSAVENGRKLKSLRCYSSAASVALEAIREGTITDARFDSSPEVDLDGRLDRARWFWDKLEFDSIEVDRVPPDPRQPQAIVRNEEVARCVATTHSHANYVHTPKGSLRTRPLSKRRPHYLSNALAGFCASPTARSCSPATLESLQEWRIRAGGFRNVGEGTQAALGLFRRACSDVPQDRPLPSWLCELSRLLCLACQQHGDHVAAAEFLSLLVTRGPIELEAYLAHNPQDLIRHLCSAKHLASHSHALAMRQLRTAGQIFLASIENDPGYGVRAKRSWSDLARHKLLYNMIQFGMFDEALSKLRQFHKVCRFGLGTYKAIVNTFYEAGAFQQSLDAFVDLSGFTHAGERPLSRRLVEAMFHALRCTNFDAAVDVLSTMRALNIEHSESLDLRDITPMLGLHWNKSRNIDQTRFLYDRVITLLGTDTKHIYNRKSYQLHSAMIQAYLEAGDPHTAHALYSELQRHVPNAGSDNKLISRFASGDARSGNWQAARHVLQAMHSSKALNEREQRHYAEAWQQVFIEYSNTHTEGEFEEFIQESAQSHHAPLLQRTIDLVIRRYGRRRNYKALFTWVHFCQSRGFTPPKDFWLSIFVSAKSDWGYELSDIRVLYRELRPCIHDPVERVAIENLLAQIAANLTGAHMRSTMQLSPEALLYQQMRQAFACKKWDGVLKAYSEAVDEGVIGFSSRCLRLGVQSCLEAKDPKAASNMVERAKARGHNITKASIPLDLARLGRIQDQLQAWHTNDSQDRPKAYIPIEHLFTDIQNSGRMIDNAVFHKAARVCLSVRNYREAIKICHDAAETNGRGDVCYSVHSFAILSHAFVALHEYEKLRSLLCGMLRKEWRTEWYCQSSLKHTIAYLTKASESNKEDALKLSDVRMRTYVEGVLQSVLGDRANLLAQFDSISDETSELDAGEY